MTASIVLDSTLPTTARYLSTLRKADPSDVSAIDVIRILADAPEIQTLANWAAIRERVDSVAGVYRDDSGNLLVERADGAHLIIWPCRRHVTFPSAQRIEGESGELFIIGDNGRRVVPLPLARTSDYGFNWGYHGHGPSALYRALIGVALGDVPAQYNTEYMLGRRREDGLYYWLEHHFKQSEAFSVEWPEMVSRVRAEMVWRRRVDEARAYEAGADLRDQ